MSRAFLFLLWIGMGLVGEAVTASVAADPAQIPVPAFEQIPDSQVQEWEQSIQIFERTVSDQAKDLAKNEDRRGKLHEEIEKLEVKTTALRNQNNLNLFDQLRLKKMLNDLQGELETQSGLEQQWRDSLENFEQKSLSLLSLYNEEIGRQLDTTVGDQSKSQLNALMETARKRQALQTLIDRFPQASIDEKMPPLSLLEKTDNQTLGNLNTTLDILQQREKELAGNIEKADVRAAELGQEIDLQSKMRDFLSDVRKMNEDSSIPRESLNRGDLQTLESQTQDSNVQKEIEADQKQKAKDQSDLTQVRRLIQVVQAQIQNLSGGVSQ
jgi:hypothetical protein